MFVVEFAWLRERRRGEGESRLCIIHIHLLVHQTPNTHSPHHHIHLYLFTMSLVRKGLSAAEKAALAPYGGWHGKGTIDWKLVDEAFGKTIWMKYLNNFPKKYHNLIGSASIIGLSLGLAAVLKPDRQSHYT